MLIESSIAWCIHVIVVWLGARRTGRCYGVIFGALCSSLWVILSVSHFEMTAIVGFLPILAAGVGSMVTLGFVSGGRRRSEIVRVHSPSQRSHHYHPSSTKASERGWFAVLSELPRQFATWLDQYRQHIDPWPAFEYHIRSVLQGVCKASDINAYRVLDEDLILPLSEMGPHRMEDCIRVGHGVVGWVVRNRRSYCDFADDSSSELCEMLETRSRDINWCFPIIRGPNVVGVVTVGAFDDIECVDLQLLKLLAGMVGEQWGCVAEICRARVATVTDQASGLLTRIQFLREAPMVVERSQRQSKPVTAAAFSIDGLRSLDEQGYWGLRDQAIASVGDILRKRVSPVDCVGRFNDARFVLVWQGLDGNDARTRAQEIVGDIEQMFTDRKKWQHTIKVHCGISSCRTTEGSLRSLVAAALARSKGCRHESLDGAVLLQDDAHGGLNVVYDVGAN